MAHLTTCLLKTLFKLQASFADAAKPVFFVVLHQQLVHFWEINVFGIGQAMFPPLVIHECFLLLVVQCLYSLFECQLWLFLLHFIRCFALVSIFNSCIILIRLSILFLVANIRCLHHCFGSAFLGLGLLAGWNCMVTIIGLLEQHRLPQSLEVAVHVLRVNVFHVELTQLFVLRSSKGSLLGFKDWVEISRLLCFVVREVRSLGAQVCLDVVVSLPRVQEVPDLKHLLVVKWFVKKRGSQAPLLDELLLSSCLHFDILIFAQSLFLFNLNKVYESIVKFLRRLLRIEQGCALGGR